MKKMRPRRSSRGSISWLPLMALVMAVITPTIHAQPTFDECKIFMIASDVGRDLILQKEPDYIRFLNLVARTHLIPHGFETYDELPVELQNLYKAYAWTEKQEIDISAAMFGAPATEDELLVLGAFCNETSDYIASTVVTEMPTWAPTALSPEFDETASPTTLLPQLNRDIANGVDIPDGHTTELPIQCRRGMFGSDTDRDGFLTQAEYTTFVNRLSTNAYAHAASFEALPQELQDNFNRLAETDGVALLNVYGAIPSQWSEATRTQQQFLTLICHRTEASLMSAHNNSQGGVTPTTATEPPLIILPDATNPLVNATVPPATASPATASPTPISTNTTGSEASSSTQEGKKKMNKNKVAVIVGSILIFILTIYLAHDKTNFFRDVHAKLKKMWLHAQSNWRNSRVQPQPASSRKDKQIPDSSHFDVEEQTGFLEDQRMCTLNTVIDQQINSNANGDFNTIRFNPDDHIPIISEDIESVTSVYDIPTDSEEPQNKHDNMGFSFDDEDAGIGSDDESLYCNSVSGNPAKASTSISQAPQVEPSTESISPETQYSAKRMEHILRSESRYGSRIQPSLPVEGDSLQTRTSNRNRLERVSNRNKLEQRTKAKMEAKRKPLSEPLPPQKASSKNKTADSWDRLQKYARDKSDSSDSSWDNDDMNSGEELSLGLEDGPSISGESRPDVNRQYQAKIEDSLDTSSTTFQDSDPLVDSSDGDSTYNGTETESSFGIQSDSERPVGDDDISICSKLSEIHRLVRKVMPGETGNVNRMLIQYKGREEELLNTMRRLEARVDAKNATGRPIHASPSMDASTNAATHRRTALLEKASTVSENAALLASALSYGQSGKNIHGAKNPYDRGAKSVEESSDDDVSFCKEGINWGPSAEIDDDDFSKDSTYFETSTHAGDDETVSLFSHN